VVFHVRETKKLNAKTVSRSMSFEHTVSAIIPTYNRRPLLERALKSIFRQTRRPDEVLVIDDGSTDDTPAHIPERFPDVRYIRQARGGVSTARNCGIREAKGEWLAFLDSDDEWLPQKLECQLEALGAKPEFLLCHTNEIWIRRGRRVNPMKKHEKFGGRIFQACLPLCIISPSSTVLHRNLFDEVGLFDEDFPVCEDYDLWLRVCARRPVLYLDEPLTVKYGGHDDQLSRSLWGMDRFRIRALEQVISSDALSTEDRLAAIRTLLEKIDIYLTGGRKRGKWDEIFEYEQKKTLYEKLC
jgi:glycosyltransferase involved in cell wall biosynthesis